MLCNHGTPPSETMKIPFKERLLMWELLKKEMREVKRK